MPKIVNIYNVEFVVCREKLRHEDWSRLKGWVIIDHRGEDLKDHKTGEVMKGTMLEGPVPMMKRAMELNVPEGTVLVEDDDLLCLYLVEGLEQGDWPTMEASFLSMKWPLIEDFHKRVLDPEYDAYLDDLAGLLHLEDKEGLSDGLTPITKDKEEPLTPFQDMGKHEFRGDGTNYYGDSDDDGWDEN
jgi:hypothetical protein